MPVETILKEIGLSEKEIKVYLACLKLGAVSVRKIAEETRVNRGTTYDILKSLLKQGLVAYFHKKTHQYFIAENPERLIDLLKSKKQKLIILEKDIRSIIPELKSVYDNAGNKPVARFYEGFSGLKFILQDVLNCVDKTGKKQYFVYSAESMRQYLHQAYADFTKERIKRGIKVKVIALGRGGKLCGLDERKWISKKDSAPTYIIIYEQKVALISVDKLKNPLGVILEDQGIYETQKMLFEFMWKNL